MAVDLVRLNPGECVRIRGERWRVERCVRYDTAAILEVAGTGRGNRGCCARFVLPAEPLERLPASSVPRVVRPNRWRRIARAALWQATPEPHSLRCAAAAAIDLVPFQLEPALAVTGARACRLLIADEVGLGKTVQAGLVIAEVLARTPDARALVLCPAALRSQWRGELAGRYALDARILDATTIRPDAAREAAANPWAMTPVAISSIDFVKRPEVMRASESLVWDVIVFDEAHNLAGDSDRAAAAALLASRARRVLLLTATPHSGNADAFARLCRTGQLPDDEPLLIFRRTRADAGIATKRKTLVLRVKPTADERAMHRELGRYVRRVSTVGEPAARLAMEVLMRRASSSAAALARSIERRLQLLAAEAPAAPQPRLPFGDAGDSDEALDAALIVPGLADGAEERRRLEHLHALACRAATDESKIAALARLRRRGREPALIFTEYRDTLLHLAAQLSDRAVHLHGGMTLGERLASARAFTGGDALVMLATDAASEGLNLHRRCRLVVTLELPWTPTRLEQRIGRVDRIGQQRTVHALHLVAAGTHEERLVSRLASRRHTARTALDVPAAANFGGRAEAERLKRLRALCRHRDDDPRERPVAAIVRSARCSTPCAFRVWRIPIVDEAGRLMWEPLVALAVAVARLRRTAEAARSTLGQYSLDLAAVQREAQRFLVRLPPPALLERRERAILAGVMARRGRLAATLLQPGLFDRNAERTAAAQQAIVAAVLQQIEARLGELDAQRHPQVETPTLVFAAALQ